MKIKFVSGPKAGTIEHLQPSIATTLIASGLAEHVPYKGFRERLAEESNLRAHAAAGDAAPDFLTVPSWSVKTHQVSGHIVIEKRLGSELIAYSAPPPDCPPAVVRAFESLTSAPDQLAAAQAQREKATTDQAIYNERIKTAKRW